MNINDLTSLADRPNTGRPLVPRDIHVRFVDEPPIAVGVPAGPCRVDQQRG